MSRRTDEESLVGEMVEDAAIGAVVAAVTGSPMSQGAATGAAIAVGKRAARTVLEETGLDDLFDDVGGAVADLFDW